LCKLTVPARRLSSVLVSAAACGAAHRHLGAGSFQPAWFISTTLSHASSIA
jgi:hypothetical protein